MWLSEGLPDCFFYGFQGTRKNPSRLQKRAEQKTRFEVPQNSYEKVCRKNTVFFEQYKKNVTISFPHLRFFVTLFDT